MKQTKMTRWVLKVYSGFLCLLALGITPLTAIAAKNLSIGLLYDGTVGNSVIEATLLRKEIRNILEPDYKVSFITAEGLWTSEGVEEQLSRLLNDKSTDIVITMGLVGSHIAGHTPGLSKPVIATFVPDPVLQKIPLSQ